MTYNDGTGARVYVGGKISQIHTVVDSTDPTFGVARWDGVYWEEVPPSNGIKPYLVRAMETFNDGDGDKLYAGGQFIIDGNTVEAICSWKNSTYGWELVMTPAADPINTTATGAEIHTFAHANGTIYFGGRARYSSTAPFAPIFARYYFPTSSTSAQTAYWFAGAYFHAPVTCCMPRVSGSTASSTTVVYFGCPKTDCPGIFFEMPAAFGSPITNGAHRGCGIYAPYPYASCSTECNPEFDGGGTIPDNGTEIDSSTSPVDISGYSLSTNDPTGDCDFGVNCFLRETVSGHPTVLIGGIFQTSATAYPSVVRLVPKILTTDPTTHFDAVGDNDVYGRVRAMTFHDADDGLGAILHIGGNDLQFVDVSTPHPAGAGIIAHDPTVDAWKLALYSVSNIGDSSEDNNYVTTVASYPESLCGVNQLLSCGVFAAIETNSTVSFPAVNVALMKKCLADFNCDGFVDTYDFSDFVDGFESGTADVNCDGFVDIYDFTDFVTWFEDGCETF